SPPLGATVKSIGYGLGTRELNNSANAIRGMVFEQDSTIVSDSCWVIETNIDDLQPELVASLTEKLFEKGALDVFTVPIQMKKQRCGLKVSALCNETVKSKIIEVFFRESTTFGVRMYQVERAVLNRRHIEVNTEFGSVRMKVGSREGCDITFVPEYEDCIKLAKTVNVPTRVVYGAALRSVPW
ncbi:MAG: LarC family nickel insertion protein, partial [Lentisphaerae bacterium]|nr:LarC family nickel insertion protein [Lentisphaerota bacterium]